MPALTTQYESYVNLNHYSIDGALSPLGCLDFIVLHDMNNEVYGPVVMLMDISRKNAQHGGSDNAVYPHCSYGF
ncbi:MAG: hypothetical protein ACFB0G_07025 [Leptolyngbyaceae cyanobacterium]